MTNQKQGQTYYGALNYGNKEFLVQPYEKGGSANTISFLKYFRTYATGTQAIATIAQTPSP
ncbi:hypothetical protein [Microcoleus sp. herbarium2]|uniref:hypothetical protein n=1 Tax=Microcoleus sp. herbarium2 TaxID=3055433 RepID=UPI002FD41970